MGLMPRALTVCTCTGDIDAAGIARMNESRMGQEEQDEDTSRLALPNAQEA
jgi:amidophosphoribosyltransferase